MFFSIWIWLAIAENANAYAANAQTSPNQWPWYLTTWEEIKVLFWVILYMGLHPKPSIPDYWRLDGGPLHRDIHPYMSLVWFEQLPRFLHIPPVCPWAVQHPERREVDDPTMQPIWGWEALDQLCCHNWSPYYQTSALRGYIYHLPILQLISLWLSS